MVKYGKTLKKEFSMTVEQRHTRTPAQEQFLNKLEKFVVWEALVAFALTVTGIIVALIFHSK